MDLHKILKDRKDIRVTRSPGPDSVITKSAKGDAGRAELLNELRFLRTLSRSRFVPQVINEEVFTSERVDKITLQDVGDNFQPVDEYRFRTHFLRMLDTFRRLEVIHGDLTSANIRLIDDWPIVLDWGESRFADEQKPDKRPEGDIHHAFEYMANLADGARIGRRFFAMWKAIQSHEYSPPWYWLDIGCYHGDIAASAAAAGFEVTAIDRDADAIRQSKNRFRTLDIDFKNTDVVNFPGRIDAEVSSCLSMYPYLLRDRGDIVADQVIERLIDGSNIFFFESQLFGDGPGPEEFKTNHDIEVYLYDRGANSVEPIVEIALPDRNTSRTVFKVTQ